MVENTDTAATTIRHQQTMSISRQNFSNVIYEKQDMEKSSEIQKSIFRRCTLGLKGYLLWKRWTQQQPQNSISHGGTLRSKTISKYGHKVKKQVPRWIFIQWLAILGRPPTKDRLATWGSYRSCVACQRVWKPTAILIYYFPMQEHPLAANKVSNLLLSNAILSGFWEPSLSHVVQLSRVLIAISVSIWFWADGPPCLVQLLEISLWPKNDN